MEVLPSALGRMLQVLSRPLLHLLTRPLMKFYPSQMLQLLGLWRLHRGRGTSTGLESPRLCLARPLLQLLSRPGITMATELHQLEQSRPLCPQMPRRL